MRASVRVCIIFPVALFYPYVFHNGSQINAVLLVYSNLAQTLTTTILDYGKKINFRQWNNSGLKMATVCFHRFTPGNRKYPSTCCEILPCKGKNCKKKFRLVLQQKKQQLLQIVNSKLRKGNSNSIRIGCYVGIDYCTTIPLEI